MLKIKTIKRKFIIIIMIIFAGLFFSNCKTSQQDLLNGNLGPQKPSIGIDRIAAVNSTVVEIHFKESIDASSFSGSGDFLVEKTSGGILNVNSATQSSTNSQVFYLVTDAQTASNEYTLKVFNLKGYDGTQAPSSGVSGSFLGFDPSGAPPNPTMNSFELVLNQSALTNQPFSVTINAIGSDGNFFSGYSGTINLSSTGGTGQLYPLTANIINGKATLNLTYSSLTPNLIVSMKDPTAPAYDSSSAPFQVATGTGGNASMNVTAAAISTTTVRLGWEKMAGSSQYKIYRKTGAATYALVNTITPSVTYWVDDNATLGLTPSTTYDYMVEAIDVTSTVIGVAYASATTNTCNIVTPGAAPATIATNTTWTKSGGPYCVTANLTVDSWLVIQPGVVVLFSPGTSMTIGLGQLNAEGTAKDMVLFTSNSATPARGDWNGIIFSSTAVPSTIDMNNNQLGGSYVSFSAIEYAKRGLDVNVSLAVEYSVIKDNADLTGAAGTDGAGIRFNVPSGGKGLLRYSSIINNEVADVNGGGVWVTGPATGAGDIVIDKTFFVNNKTATVTTGLNSVGGGLVLVKNAGLNVSLSNSYFYNEQAKSGGAVYLSGISSALISRNVFENIFSSNSDGIVYFHCPGSCNSNQITDNSFKNISGGVFGTMSYGLNGQFNTNIISHNDFNQITNVNGGIFDVRMFQTANFQWTYFNTNQIINNNIQNVSVSGSGGVFYFDLVCNWSSAGRMAQGNIINYNIISNVSASGSSAFLYSARKNGGCFAGGTNTANHQSRVSADLANNSFLNSSSMSPGDLIYDTVSNGNTTLGSADYNLNKNLVQQNNTTNQLFSLNAGTGSSYTWNVSGNSFEVLNNIFSQSGTVVTTHTWSTNYWGTTWGGTVPSTCDTTGTLCIGDVFAISPVTSPYPHCDVSPTNANCVGAHKLCTVDPADANCVGIRP